MTTTTFVDNSTVVPAAWLNDVDTAAYKTLSSVSGTNTITATGPANATLAAGLAFEFIAAGANTGAVTLNVTPSGGAALGAKSITKFGTTALVTGDIVSGGAYRVIYDGTRFVLLNPGIVPAANTSGLAASGAVTASGLTMSTARMLGRTTAGAGAPEELTAANVAAFISAASDAAQGAVELATTAETQTGTDTARAVTPAGMQASKLISMGQTTASTGVVQFSSIPSWVKRITIQVDAVSPSTTALIYVQIGDSGGLESSGYASTTFGGFTGSSVSAETRSDGFFLNITGADAATNAYGGTMVLTLMDAASFKWIANGTFRTGAGTASGYSVAGYKNLTAALDRVALVTSAGTFDAGSVNVIYE